MTDVLKNNEDLLHTKKNELKIQKKQKSEIARQFKFVQSGSTEHEKLKADMQIVSVRLNELEAEIKTLEKSLHAAANTETAAAEKSPPLFYVANTQFSDEFELSELNISDLAHWDEFLKEFSFTTAYHLPQWRQLITQSFGHPTRIFVARDKNKKIIGGLPLVFFDTRLFGKFAVSIPYVNYGGVISHYFNVAQALVQQLSGLCVQEGLKYIEVRTMQSDLSDYASNKKASMILQLPKDEASLDQSLGAKVRAQFNKGDEHQLTIKFGKQELLDDFYRVFATNMRDLGTPVYSKKWFAAILDNATVDSTLAIVYHQKKPVSCGFLVGNAGMLEIPWASTVKQANSLNANMWMYRKILGYAIQKGYAFFDFGRSTQEAGTYKFKKQWGSLPYVHYWYSFTANGNQAGGELNPDNPKFKLVIAIWKRLPVWLTKLAGPLIIKDIP